MGLTSSRGKRPARLHSSMMGTRLSSMNWRVVLRTRRSSSVSSESKWMKSTPRNLMAGMMNLRDDENGSQLQKLRIQKKPRNRSCKRRSQTGLPPAGTRRVPESKHMTVAGARERGQREPAKRRQAQPSAKAANAAAVRRSYYQPDQTVGKFDSARTLILPGQEIVDVWSRQEPPSLTAIAGQPENPEDSNRRWRTSKSLAFPFP